MKSFKLDPKSFEYVIKTIYNSEDAKKYHGTEGFDRFDKKALMARMREMIACNEHEPCKVLSMMFKDGIE